MKRPRIGNLLILIGAASILFTLAAYLIQFYGNDRVLPAPVELSGEGSRGSEAASLTSTVDSQLAEVGTGVASATVSPTETVVPFAVPSTAISPTLKIAPTPTRSTAKPGVPIRLVIPSIDIDSSVQEIGTYWENGELLWETVPFVVGHYRTTAKAGDTGNAVFSGHVTSRSAGNVFRDLFRIRVGDEVHIYTEDARFVYVVTDVRLVLPTETSVMDPTEDATATLITCAGEWIQSEREYTHRLIVTTKLKR
ncbi:MAG: sortase [Chloroflexota bacterium]|jgi:LPXTG-site transpeptidase (sortase) family protein